VYKSICSVFIDIRRIDWNDPRVRGAVIQPPVSQVIIPLFSGGESTFQTKSTVFGQMPLYNTTPDVITATIAEAGKYGITVYGFLDLLHWTRPTTPMNRDVLLSHPEWAERVADGSTGNPSFGKFATPFHPAVWSEINRLVVAVVEKYPELNGLVFRLGLPASSFYGFSTATRAAVIRACRIDPVDIEISSPDERQKLLSETANFRLSFVNQRITTLFQMVRRVNKRLALAVIGDATLYQLNVKDRNRTLNDWLSWLSPEGASEVVLEADWMSPQLSNGYASAATLIRKLGKTVAIKAMIPLRVGNRATDTLVWLNTIRSQGAEAVTFMVDSPSDIARLSGVVQAAQRPVQTP
jgi:uncharacterized lipoprotein YddW (UPF0748 family)